MSSPRSITYSRVADDYSLLVQMAGHVRAILFIAHGLFSEQGMITLEGFPASSGLRGSDPQQR